MFRQIYQWIESKLPTNRPSDLSQSLGQDGALGEAGHVRLRCRVQFPKKNGSPRSPLPSVTGSVVSIHAATIYQMSLRRLKLFSSKRCQQLEKLGIDTAGALVDADPHWIAGHFSAKKKAERSIRHYQQAIRVAASVPEMLPHHASLLFRIHRKHRKGLAAETPTKLFRDLQRYSESTSGRKHLRGGALPPVERIKVWIDHCAKTESFEFQQSMAG